MEEEKYVEVKPQAEFNWLKTETKLCAFTPSL